ncbi:uncharacterized protein LOC129182892 [Dunckerocampus dactyliophorus]|uniref:uncharacterized protein LOC129182892 n=1 Tax=Dunckerocampus dactyliophorus TaxID=161453 RepID=UPI002404F1A4|nr:uncharacterized protein LOC129182892 [Dunckerocampus dactyliophorus]XP_054635511.1 uncharacterized protein LOC129182892 [Dunckerocampus dactyliophorus]
MEEKRIAKTQSKGSSVPPQLCDDDVGNTFQQQVQAAEQHSLTKEDVVIETTVAECCIKQNAESSTSDAFEDQQQQSVSNPIGVSQLERNDSEHRNDQEENMNEEGGPTLSQTGIDQHQILPPTSVEASGSGAAALEDQQTTENECDFKKKQKRALSIVTEAATGEPAKKKKRMGMCGLMAKEASHFLHCKNGQTQEERPAFISRTSVVVTQPREQDVLPSSQHSTPDSETVCKPSGVDDKDHDREQDSLPGLDQTGPPQEEENQHFGYPKPQEVDCGPSNVTHSEMDVRCVAVATTETRDETHGDPVDESRAQSGAELCEAALSGASERNDMRGTPVEDAPLAVKAEHTQTNSMADSLASGGLDFVSDTQLNSIALIEEQTTKEEDEDATELMCGLIRELSFLNRTVMAAHREIDSMRRARKNSRSVPR